ncbi:hypothetical protein LGZ99_20560 [Photorhabdus temperata]|uniref:Lipoprotein n=1 Tax=Photorhabdus temperata subsp. temperata Meg1 TaxID=1393735 RepID=A0A081RS56_PHOTE|nr:hypothetical protein [Photorhabdus temperata]KER01509.1 hypothetical protein MEG1DRAFT_03874 [Photorhabdus temperata subsp. temperata Meg1]MCT8349522.1 hypothetical protein [Photorhabdus temperata]
MKRLTALLIGSILLSGCAQMVEEQNKKDAETKASLMECSEPKLDDKYLKPTKEDFIAQLNRQALFAEAYKSIAGMKMDRLNISGLTQSDDLEVVGAIGDCNRKQTEQRISIVKPQFESLKSSTKNKVEKVALIKAYSEWVSYVKNNTGGNDARERVKLDSAIAEYENQ